MSIESYNHLSTVLRHHVWNGPYGPFADPLYLFVELPEISVEVVEREYLSTEEMREIQMNVWIQSISALCLIQHSLYILKELLKCRISLILHVEGLSVDLLEQITILFTERSMDCTFDSRCLSLDVDVSSWEIGVPFLIAGEIQDDFLFKEHCDRLHPLKENKLVHVGVDDIIGKGIDDIETIRNIQFFGSLLQAL